MCACVYVTAHCMHWPCMTVCGIACTTCTCNCRSLSCRERSSCVMLLSFSCTTVCLSASLSFRAASLAWSSEWVFCRAQRRSCSTETGGNVFVHHLCCKTLVWFTRTFTKHTNLVVFFSDLPVLQYLLQIRVQSVLEPHHIVSLSLALSQTPLASFQLQTKGEQGALCRHQLALHLGECQRFADPLWSLEKEWPRTKINLSSAQRQDFYTGSGSVPLYVHNVSPCIEKAGCGGPILSAYTAWCSAHQSADTAPGPLSRINHILNYRSHLTRLFIYYLIIYNKDKHSPHCLWCCWTQWDLEWFFPGSEQPDGLNAAHTPSRSASPAVSTHGDRLSLLGWCRFNKYIQL